MNMPSPIEPEHGPAPRRITSQPKTDADTSPTPPAQSEAAASIPLGAVHPSASYGLVTIAAWATLVVTTGAAGHNLYELLSGAEQPPTAFDVKQMLPGALLGGMRIVQLLEAIAFGLILVALAKRLDGLDAKATWITWRSASLPRALGNPEESSLPFILPLTVSGGVLTIIGLMVAADEHSGIAQSVTMVQRVGGGLAIAVVGAMVAVTGLAMGDLRRFLWRMDRMGKALPRRKRGDEISMGEPLRFRGPLKRSASAGFMLCTLALLGVSYIGVLWIVWQQIRIMQVNGSAGAMRIMGIDSGTLVALTMASMLGIIGGAYSLWRLASLWADVLHGWEWTAGTVGKPLRKSFGAQSTETCFYAGWFQGGLIMALTFLMIVSIPGFPIFWAFLTFTSLGCCAAFIIWLGALKKDSFRYVRALTTIARRRPPKATGTKWNRSLAWALLALCGLHFCGAAYMSVVMINAMGTVAATLGNAAFGMQVYMALLLVTAFSLTIFPNILAALILLDADRALAALKLVREVPPAEKNDAARV